MACKVQKLSLSQHADLRKYDQPPDLSSPSAPQLTDMSCWQKQPDLQKQDCTWRAVSAPSNSSWQVLSSTRWNALVRPELSSSGSSCTYLSLSIRALECKRSKSPKHHEHNLVAGDCVFET